MPGRNRFATEPVPFARLHHPMMAGFGRCDDDPAASHRTGADRGDGAKMLSLTRKEGQFAVIGDQVLVRVQSGSLKFHIVADRLRFPVSRVQAGHSQFHLCQLAISHFDRLTFEVTSGQHVLWIGSDIRISFSLKSKPALIDVLAPDMRRVVLARFRSRQQTALEADRVGYRFPVAAKLSQSGAA